MIHLRIFTVLYGRGSSSYIHFLRNYLTHSIGSMIVVFNMILTFQLFFCKSTYKYLNITTASVEWAICNENDINHSKEPWHCSLIMRFSRTFSQKNMLDTDISSHLQLSTGWIFTANTLYAKKTYNIEPNMNATAIFISKSATIVQLKRFHFSPIKKRKKFKLLVEC